MMARGSVKALLVATSMTHLPGAALTLLLKEQLPSVKSSHKDNATKKNKERT